ncbi:MAG: FtsW/RodA/SpoVE family cell cycle protein, partial [Alphaproteobacteria bacterium]
MAARTGTQTGRLGSNQSALSLGTKFSRISYSYVILICMVATIGFAMLYSVADGSFDPYASRQMIRFGLGLSLFFIIAVIDIRLILMAAYPAYVGTLLLLGAVEIFGHVGMGAQRWIDLGFLQLQPSELMKISILLAMARFFHGLPPDRLNDPRYLAIPALL